MKRRSGYHVAGGFVSTARCVHCGGTYTKGDYSAHVRKSHTGHVWAAAEKRRAKR